MNKILRSFFVAAMVMCGMIAQAQTKCSNIAEFLKLADKTEAELTLKDAIVVADLTEDKGTYQTYHLWVRDASGALYIYNINALKDVKAGTKLNGSIMLKMSIYNGLPEGAYLKGKTSADGLTMEPGAAVEPLTCKVSEIADHMSDLVQLNTVEVVAVESTNGPNYYAKTGDGQTQLFPKMDVKKKALAAASASGKKYTVVGVVSSYKGTAQIYPIKLTEEVTAGISAVAAGQDPDAPVYNLNGQQVGTDYKGVVIQKGKKFVRK